MNNTWFIKFSDTGSKYIMLPGDNLYIFFPLCSDRYFRYAHSEDQNILDITVLGRTLDKYRTALTIGPTTWANTIIWNNNSPTQDPWVAYRKQPYCFTELFVYFVGKLMLDKNTTYLLSLSTCELCGTSLDLMLRNFGQAFWTMDNLYGNLHVFSQKSNTTL